MVNLTVLRQMPLTPSSSSSTSTTCQEGPEKEKAVTFNELWQQQTCVIVFLRRLNCPYCRLAASEISKISGQLKARNVRLVGICPGFSGLEDFQKREYFTGDLFSDDLAESYAVCGFKRMSPLQVLPSLFSAEARHASWRARQLGFGRHVAMTGNKLQNGGVLVVQKGGGRVSFRFEQSSAMDMVDNQAVLDACLEDVVAQQQQRSSAKSERSD